MIRRIRLILIVLVTLTVFAMIFEVTRPYRPDNPLDARIDDLLGGRSLHYSLAEAVYDSYIVYMEMPAGIDPEDLGLKPVSPKRQSYQDDEMILKIPSLDFQSTVKAGTNLSAIRNSPGLFEASGLPGEEGANVSIAGHRTRGTFYYLDRIGTGDVMHLIFGTYKYTYVYHDSRVVMPTDWSVIAEQGFSASTLVTCTPIGRANRRLVVTFKLDSVESFTEPNY